MCFIAMRLHGAICSVFTILACAVVSQAAGLALQKAPLASPDALAPNGTGHGSRTATGNVILTNGKLSWSVVMSAPGLAVVEQATRSDDDSVRFFARSDSGALLASGYLEKAPQPGNARDCREHYRALAARQDRPYKEEDVRTAESGDIATVEYTVREAGGQTVNQRNLHAYLARDGWFVDIHVSKFDYAAGDEKLLADVLSTIRIVPRREVGQRELCIELPDRDRVAFTLPAGWSFDLKREEKTEAPTLKFTGDGAVPLSVLVSFFRNPPGEVPGRALDRMRTFVQHSAKKHLPGAVEKDAPLKELNSGGTTTGYYYVLTDKAPKPGEYLMMTQGASVVGEVWMVFTVLANDSTTPAVTAALEMLSGMRHVARSE